MSTTLTAVLWAHIAAGLIALVVAPVAMVTAKGGPTHRRWGKVYFWMMAVVAATAIVLGVQRPNVFLTLVAVFSFYAAFSGYRVLGRKRPDRGERARPLDWAAALITLGASLALVGLGWWRPSPTWQRLGTVAIAFGFVGMFLAGQDLWKFVRPPTERQQWWFDHMVGMLGSYIATVSAFSVVNFTYLPTLVRWLWPSIIGTPLIILWVTYYKLRFSRRTKPAAV